ncbi:uncharacterized protein LOC111049483 isoform X3 [Nilaparvata lugens]|uniref:uncharacterized protein LOC111049483 isoform X3 n=1 Tax=Nilaparvata lugens TaxID=108931 RepID=UPI00193D431F|nr:uncharacterized protein LOC111049483 isoform X3 [Nilaparvata lugens]
MTGAVDLDVFLYNTPGQNPTQIKYLKSISPFAREERVLTLLKHQELKHELAEIHAKYGGPPIEEWRNYELSPSEIQNQDDNYYWTSRALVKLSDVITDEDLLRFVHRILFVSGGDSFFFLIIGGTIFGIGVVFNGLLLVGAHTNNVTAMSAWVPYQRLLFAFDLYCLLVITVVSSTPALALFQTARIYGSGQLSQSQMHF